MTFGERFEETCRRAPLPVCLGLDPRLDEVPAVVRERAGGGIRETISRFHELAISAVADLLPAVKLQLAFYEQYGVAGMEAFVHTTTAARKAGLLVIADGKRNDIPTTAEAYARAFLDRSAFDADALTVNPYLGWDSLVPFAEAAAEHGKGVFVLTHTSNASAPDIQEIPGDDPVYLRSARFVERLSQVLFPDGRFSSVGAIVGCTFPAASAEIRQTIPRSPIIVVGYGAQAGVLDGCTACFTDRADGALVNASRSLTYADTKELAFEEDVSATIRAATERMGSRVVEALPDAAEPGNGRIPRATT
jgi:orotidine-5'-phosphate decarboxylase